jgi:PAS domain S-box-containing protein
MPRNRLGSSRLVSSGGADTRAIGDRIAPVKSAGRLALLWTFGAAGAVVLGISLRDLLRHPVGSPFFVLISLTLVTGWSTLRMRTAPISFSISDTFTIAAALLFGPAAGTVIVVLDSLVMSLRVAHTINSSMWARVMFNVTATALAMWLAAHLFFAITQTGPLADQPGRIRDVIGALAIFGATYFFLNTGFVAVAVAYERRARTGTVWREHLSALWLAYFSGASIGGLLVLMNVARVVDVTTMTFVLPILFILHVTYRAALDRMQEQVQQFARTASYEAALRSTADAVVVTGDDGHITLLNPAAERLTGWAERDASGRHVTEVFRALDPVTRTPEDGSRWTGEPPAREYILIRRDSTESPIEQMQARVRDATGHIIGTIRTFRDVSLRKASEAEREALLDSERRARATADAANRLKDEFVTTLSHELRTPATGILGWVRLLKTGSLDDMQRGKALDALERSARAQAALLEDLLDLSRIVRGTLRLELRPTDVRDVLTDAVKTVDAAILSKGIDFRLDMPADLPLVHGDPDRLQQVLWNLLSNAVKFTDSGGSIRVSVVAEPEHLRVEVTDTGRGIDAESLPFIFDRFRQADGSTTRSHGGLGMGLAIVRHLVESHGGTVTAASEGRGRGARFIIRVPTVLSAPQTGQLDATG